MDTTRAEVVINGIARNAPNDRGDLERFWVPESGSGRAIAVPPALIHDYQYPRS